MLSYKNTHSNLALVNVYISLLKNDHIHSIHCSDLTQFLQQMLRDFFIHDNSQKFNTIFVYFMAKWVVLGIILMLMMMI